MTDRYSQDDTLRVRKRDGSIEPFWSAKLLDGIRRGLEAGGEAPGLAVSTATGLAEAVHEHVRRTCQDTLVESKLLSELVEVVLNQTGFTAACMAFQRYQSYRARQRRRVMVASLRPSDGRYRRRRWNKSHIVEHLRRRHLLEVPVARMMAGRVEQSVFDCGLDVVTSGLVYEMIKSELLAWGLLPGALVVKKTRSHRRGRKIKDKTDTA